MTALDGVPLTAPSSKLQDCVPLECGAVPRAAFIFERDRGAEPSLAADANDVLKVVLQSKEKAVRSTAPHSKEAGIKCTWCGFEDRWDAKVKAVADAYKHARMSADAVARAGSRTLGDMMYASVDTFENVRPMPMGVMAMKSLSTAFGRPHLLRDRPAYSPASPLRTQ